MIADRNRFARAIARFDAANAKDPRRESVASIDCPKETVYAERMSAMLARFVPDASEALQLAARCQHIERWTIPRSGYPMTKIGYNEWRTRLRDFHADRATGILREEGYPEDTVARVGTLLRKEQLKSDAEAQALEDVVALVFFESYLGDFVAEHAQYGPAKLEDILQKTAIKMSAAGRAAALSLIEAPAPLVPSLRGALAAAQTRNRRPPARTS